MQVKRCICLMCISILAGSGRGDSTYENGDVELKDPHSHSEEVKLEPNPAYEMVSKPTSTNEPQYEECGGGVTSVSVAMEVNPAHQSVDAVCPIESEEPTYI